MPKEYYEAVKDSKRRTWLLFAIFIVLILAIGWIAGLWLGSEILGTGIAIVVAVIWGLISWYAGDKIILSVSGAGKASEDDYPRLFNTVEALAIGAGIPKPEIYVINDVAPNAFATGRDPDNAKIAVTTGLLEKMDKDELEGVIAHEISHIRNEDIKVMMLAAVLTGIIVLLGHLFLRMMLFSGGGRKKGGAVMLLIGLAFVIASPFIAQLIKLTISRRREYLADASAVDLARNPDGLIGALRKLDEDKTKLSRANGATAHLYIEDPMKKEEGFFAKLGGLFSTHPPLEDRINRLQEMAAIG